MNDTESVFVTIKSMVFKENAVLSARAVQIKNRLLYSFRMTADLLESGARGFPTPVRDMYIISPYLAD